MNTNPEGSAKTTAKKYVITGGPAIGKTEVVKELRARGHKTSTREIARDIYHEFRTALGHHLTVNERQPYSATVLKEKVREYALHMAVDFFFDRGIPDGIGWDWFFGLEPPIDLLDAVATYRYDRVFILDPLHKYEQEDDEVWAKEREAQRVHQLIIQGYVDSGYEPIFVPLMPVDRRVDFILQNV